MEFTDIMVGILAGLVAGDWANRMLIMRKIKQSENEMTNACSKLAELHNNQIETIKDLTGRIETLEKTNRIQALNKRF